MLVWRNPNECSNTCPLLPGASARCHAYYRGPLRPLQANGKFSTRGPAKSQVVSSVVPQCFYRPMTANSWDGLDRFVPKEIVGLYNSFPRMCDSVDVKFPDTRPYVGGIYKSFQLKSQNSLAGGSVHGVHCLLGNHKRAFPCRSNPINCLPSSCSESVEPDGEECVLSRCSTGNLSALKGRGAACLRRWHTGAREDLLVETSTFP